MSNEQGSQKDTFLINLVHSITRECQFYYEHQSEIQKSDAEISIPSEVTRSMQLFRNLR